MSEAVWRTILRPRPPPGSWQRGQPPQRGVQEGTSRDEYHTNSQTGHDLPKVQGIRVAQPPPRLSQDERVSEACVQVLRLEAALQVLGEDSPEGQPIKEALKKARDQSRALPIGERLDHLDVEGQDRENSSRLHTRTASFAASIEESATVARRSNQQCSRSPSKRPPTRSNGRRQPRGRGPEVESSGCRVAASASFGARDGRKSCQEGAHIVHSNSSIGSGGVSWCCWRIKPSVRRKISSTPQIQR